MTILRSALDTRSETYRAAAEAMRDKLADVEAGEWVANQGVQLFGGMGYMAESEIERQYRDMRIIGIGGGTTEILTSLAAKLLGFQS